MFVPRKPGNMMSRMLEKKRRCQLLALENNDEEEAILNDIKLPSLKRLISEQCSQEITQNFDDRERNLERNFEEDSSSQKMLNVKNVSPKHSGKETEIDKKSFKEEEFSCSYCPYIARSPDSFENHLMLHLQCNSDLSKKQFSCSSCSYISHCSIGYAKHILLHSEGNLVRPEPIGIQRRKSRQKIVKKLCSETLKAKLDVLHAYESNLKMCSTSNFAIPKATLIENTPKIKRNSRRKMSKGNKNSTATLKAEPNSSEDLENDKIVENNLELSYKKKNELPKSTLIDDTSKLKTKCLNGNSNNVGKENNSTLRQYMLTNKNIKRKNVKILKQKFENLSPPDEIHFTQKVGFRVVDKNKDQVETEAVLNVRVLCCQFCPFSTYHKSRLTRHIKTHFKINTYKCSECSYGTYRIDHLRQHQWIHSKNKKFKCFLCKYATDIKETYLYHIENHIKYKMFMCLKCEYFTRQREEFKTHLIGCGSPFFECSSCNYLSTSKSCLQRHLHTHFK